MNCILKKHILFCILLIVSLFACQKDETQEQDLILEKQELILTKGVTQEIAIISGNGQYKATIEDEKIATTKIENDKLIIAGISVGETLIKVLDRVGKKTELKLTVMDMIVDLTLEVEDIQLDEKEVRKILIKSGNGDYNAISDDEDVVSIKIVDDELIIEGLKAGKANITVIDKKDKRAILTVEVMTIGECILLPVKIVQTWNIIPNVITENIIYDDKLRIESTSYTDTGIDESRITNITYGENDKILAYTREYYSKEQFNYENTWSFIYKKNQVQMTLSNSVIEQSNICEIDNEGFLIKEKTSYIGQIYNSFYDYDEKKNIVKKYGDPTISLTNTYIYDTFNGIYKNVNLPQWFLVQLSLTYSENLINNFVEKNISSYDQEDKWLYEIEYNIYNYPSVIIARSNRSQEVQTVNVTYQILKK